MNKQLVTVALVVALGIGFGSGYWLANSGSPRQMGADEGTSERKALFWRNPMNPAITSPVFMQDEMGMDYIPVYTEGDAGVATGGTVTIDPVTVQNIGVRTTTAVRRDLSRVLNSLGRVDFNEERLARLHPKTSGWIESLQVDETGT